MAGFLSRWAVSGRYRLPMPIVKLLEQRLLHRRHKAAAERARTLAAFLGQMHAATGRMFPLDRRKLAAAHPELGTVDQIRTSIEILEAIGFVSRAPVKGSGLRRLASGGYMRAAVLWSFGFLFERVFSWVRKSPKDRLGLFSRVRLDPAETLEKTQKPIFGGVRPKGPPPSKPALQAAANPALDALLARMGRGLGLAVA